MTIKAAPTDELRQVAMFHDLGKGITKSIDETTGIAHMIGHPSVGAMIALAFYGEPNNITDSFQPPRIGVDTDEVIVRSDVFNKVDHDQVIASQSADELFTQLLVTPLADEIELDYQSHDNPHHLESSAKCRWLICVVGQQLDAITPAWVVQPI
ncbi:hypothetical protein H7R52_18890 [Weissella confusa]|uniref:HD domain-containing protein n=1 Tax=Weissella confusa TaxID=1583 RepID=A0A923NHV2_WEICO|nr:hypothetical protein [Weissella confusa]